MLSLFDPLSQTVDSVPVPSASGNIVVWLFSDPANDIVTASYRLDGGSSLESLSGSISMPDQVHAWAFGQATPVPVPAAWLLAASAIVLLPRRSRAARSQGALEAQPSSCPGVRSAAASA